MMYCFTDLKELDQKRKESGLSIFAFSLTLDDEKANLENWSLSEFNIRCFPFAFFCIWFRYFFDISCGSDHLAILQEWFNKYNISQQVIRDLWEEKFQDNPNSNTLSNDTFKSQCWMLSGTFRGQKSELWRGLKLCLQKDPDERFLVESYAEQAPEYLRNLIKDYNRNRSVGNGKDFSEFINVLDALLEGNTEIQQNENIWYNKKVCLNANDELCSLIEKCNEVFNTDANIDLYLYHQPGTECAARYIIGVDHIRKDIPKIKINGLDSGLSRPAGSFFFKELEEGDFSGENGQCVLSWDREDHSYPKSLPSAAAFICCQNNRKDCRKFWWKQSSVIPYMKPRVMLLLPDLSTEWQQELKKAGISAICKEITSIRFYSEERFICIIDIKDRPTHSVSIQLGEQTITFSGKIPTLETRSGTCKDLFPDESRYDAVCCSNSELLIRCKDAEEGDVITWAELPGYNLTSEENGRCAKISLNTTEKPLDVLQVVCSISRDNGTQPYKRSMSVLVLSPELRTCVLAGRGKVGDWFVTAEKDDAVKVRDHLLLGNLRRYILSDNTQKYSVFTKEEQLFFWFRNRENQEEIKVAEQKFASAELKNWELCFTGDFPDVLDFDMTDQNGERRKLSCSLTQGNYGENYKYIRLEDLLGRTDRDFIFDPHGTEESEMKKICIDGTLLFSARILPFSPALCQDTNGAWGLYIPDAGTLPVLVSWFSDNYQFIEAPLFNKFQADSEEYPRFVPLCKWFNKNIVDDPGEQYIALYPRKTIQRDIKDGGRQALHMTRAEKIVQCKKASDPDNGDLLANYGMGGICEYQTQWKEAKEKHRENVFFKESRLMTFNTLNFSLDECFPAWKKILSRNQDERIPGMMTCMLENGYNFLAETEWFFQAQNGWSNSRKKYFIDNYDKKGDETRGKDKKREKKRGKGLCAALIAQSHIDKFDLLKDSEVRELTRFDSPKNIIQNLGIAALCKCNNKQCLFPVYSCCMENRRRGGKWLILDTFGKNISPYQNAIPVGDVAKTDFMSCRPVYNISCSLNNNQWQCDEASDFSFIRFQVDKTKFARQKVEFDVQADWNILLQNEKCDRAGRLEEIFSKMLTSARLNSCAKEMLSVVHDYFQQEECPAEYKADCDYKIILLTGMILCMNLTTCRNGNPADWFFTRQTDEYKLVNNIVWDMFANRIDGTEDGKIEWRCLMRTLCSFMGLFSYLNRNNNKGDK